MADKLIGSLIYDDHPIPKRSRAWKERLKVPVAIGLVLTILGFVAWKFANFREERAVSQFLEALQAKQFDIAFAKWDPGGSYRLQDFLEDWGDKGYYGSGIAGSKIVDSNGVGGSVDVYVSVDHQAIPVSIRVDKETLKLSFSPQNKFNVRR